MSHQFIDKRGDNQILPKTPTDTTNTCKECDRLGWKTTQPLTGVNGESLCWTHAQAAAKPAAPPDEKPTRSLVLSPFPDGTCLKMLKREFPGPGIAPVSFDQHILVNVVGDQLAITKNETIAHLICDAVNMLFVAQQRQQDEHAALIKVIAPTQDLPATQH